MRKAARRRRVRFSNVSFYWLKCFEIAKKVSCVNYASGDYKGVFPGKAEMPVSEMPNSKLYKGQIRNDYTVKLRHMPSLAIACLLSFNDNKAVP